MTEKEELIYRCFLGNIADFERIIKKSEYRKMIEKFHNCNRLFGFQKDENLYIDQTRNYVREYYEKEKMKYGRNCK